MNVGWVRAIEIAYLARLTRHVANGSAACVGAFRIEGLAACSRVGVAPSVIVASALDALLRADALIACRRRTRGRCAAFAGVETEPGFRTESWCFLRAARVDALTVETADERRAGSGRALHANAVPGDVNAQHIV